MSAHSVEDTRAVNEYIFDLMVGSGPDDGDPTMGPGTIGNPGSAAVIFGHVGHPAVKFQEELGPGDH